jgi:hypothetical protein
MKDARQKPLIADAAGPTPKYSQEAANNNSDNNVDFC